MHVQMHACNMHGCVHTYVWVRRSVLFYMISESCSHHRIMAKLLQVSIALSFSFALSLALHDRIFVHTCMCTHAHV